MHHPKADVDRLKVNDTVWIGLKISTISQHKYLTTTTECMLQLVLAHDKIKKAHSISKRSYKSVVNKILVLEINIFHLAYLSHILRIYKTGSNDEKRTLPKLKTQQDWKEEFPFLVFTSTSMTCKLCTKFDSKIMGCKNYNPSFVNSSTNFHKSAVKDHANTMMHSEAVKLHKIDKAKEVGEK